jgi:hypothetical protein
MMAAWIDSLHDVLYNGENCQEEYALPLTGRERRPWAESRLSSQGKSRLTRMPQKSIGK